MRVLLAATLAALVLSARSMPADRAWVEVLHGNLAVAYAWAGFALLIIAIGLGAISGLLNRSISQIRQARLRTRAMLLAESKLAEIQVGLVDVTQTESGDFDDHPPGFSWSATLAAAEVQALKTLTLTITCPGDGDEAFDYQVHRIFSPSLNFSHEKLKYIYLKIQII